MRRLFGRLATFYGKHAVTIDLALIVAGANAVKRRFLDLQDRLDQLESGGLAPRDDLVTLRDLERKVAPVLLKHRQVLIDAGLLEGPHAEVDVEVADEAAGQPAEPAAVDEAEEPAEAPGAP